MAVIFKAVALDGKLKILNLVDLETYCREMQGKELMVEIRGYARTGEKAKMLAYYHQVILQSAADGWRDTGDPCDKAEADIRLRCELAKTHRKNNAGEFVVVLEEKKDMTKERLLQFLQDCIYFIETNLQRRVPDSQSYLALKKTGRNYTTVSGSEE